MITRFLLLTFISLFTISCNSTDEYEVFLLIGQSNMAGRAPMTEEDKQAIDGVWLLDSLGNVAPAISPLNQYSSIRKGIKMQEVSIANGFAKEIKKYTDKKVLLIVNARGGTKIELWQKGNTETPYFEEAVRRCREASKYGKIKAILWHQGESNSDNYDEYMNNLTRLATDLRTELGSDKIPFIAGEVGRWNEYAGDFNPVINTISSHIPYSDFVSSESAGMRSNLKDPHFSRDGELLLGKRYAEKVNSLVY